MHEVTLLSEDIYCFLFIYMTGVGRWPKHKRKTESQQKTPLVRRNWTYRRSDFVINYTSGRPNEYIILLTTVKDEGK